MQYFEEDIISLGTNEVMVDCGGFPLSGEGDAGYFLNRSGKNSYVYLLEPDEGNMKIAKDRLKRKKTAIQFVLGAAWDEASELNFNSGRGANSGMAEDDSGVKVQAITIDSMLNGGYAPSSRWI